MQVEDEQLKAIDNIADKLIDMVNQLLVIISHHDGHVGECDKVIPDAAPHWIKNLLAQSGDDKSYTAFIRVNDNDKYGVLVRWFTPMGCTAVYVYSIKYPMNVDNLHFMQ